MYRYKKIMVGLNLDDHDENLIQYAGILSKMAKSEEIHFVYVSDTFDIPDEVKKIYPQIASPVETAIEERMKQIVEQHFNGHEDSKLIFRPLEGSLLGLLISYTKKHDIDLLIIGHQTNGNISNNTLSEKLARKAFCSVMIVPRGRKALLGKILVAVDFSDHSLNALEVGSAFAKAAGLDHIHILNNYNVPTGHHKTGKTYEEFADIMLENAKSKLRESLSKVDLKSIGIKPFFKKSDDIVKGIQEFSVNMGAHLIVVGARGRSGDIAAILLGSITEGLIRKLDRPLLAVKKKGEGLNILEAITL
ncbi:universal stress protein [Desulfospira joergensenii]|uniref:universal stress protein n=1 Tax=Desulfospira joergensenii TaxID=53329 RepID=UPI0003B5086C|nr:universal stress protein [Desulfospira joergensenii]